MPALLPLLPELYFKQLNGGALVAFGETALELLGGDIKYAEKVSGGGSDQQHGSGAYHDCVSGIAMLVSSFQDRAGRLELQVQKSG